MLYKSEAIVLHHIKYSESAVIATLYTRKYGVKTFIVRGFKKSKSGSSKKAILQPLSIVEISAENKESKSLQALKDIRTCIHYESIYFRPEKITIALFLQEILYKSLREESGDEELFEFIITSLSVLDKLEEFQDFHLLFLIKLSKYLGFYPSGTFSGKTPFFDLIEGSYVAHNKTDYTLAMEESRRIGMLLTSGYQVKLPLTNQSRRELLKGLVKLYQIHLEGIGTIKSLPVLESIFTT